MPVYKRRISTRDQRFRNRKIIIMGSTDESFLTSPAPPQDLAVFPVEDTEVICNSCNQNIFNAEEETFGWLIYFDKRDVKANRPYDFYCDNCTKRNFPKATEV